MALGGAVEWTSELENQISSFVAGTIPPCLSPFARDGEVYIPVITKSEIGQAFLQKQTAGTKLVHTWRVARLACDERKWAERGQGFITGILWNPNTNEYGILP